MQRLPARLPIILAALAVMLIIFLYFAPKTAMAFLTQVGNLWSIVLLAGTAGTLLWFVYWVAVRRILRARHIARIRSHRLLIEAAHRDRE